jgi:hypothetical protein
MAKAATDIASTTTDLFKLLEPLEPELRKRAIKAALTMLGDDAAVTEAKPKGGGAADDVGEDIGDLNTKTRTWMRQNNLTAEQLSHSFQGTEIIAHQIPGANKQEQTLNTYILTGVAQLVQTGEPRFSDDVARQACEQHGCYDANNHSRTINKKRGNAFSGSVKTGWQLTTPGLKTGSDLVKAITGA